MKDPGVQDQRPVTAGVAVVNGGQVVPADEAVTGPPGRTFNAEIKYVCHRPCATGDAPSPPFG